MLKLIVRVAEGAVRRRELALDIQHPFELGTGELSRDGGRHAGAHFVLEAVGSLGALRDVLVHLDAARARHPWQNARVHGCMEDLLNGRTGPGLLSVHNGDNVQPQGSCGLGSCRRIDTRSQGKGVDD